MWRHKLFLLACGGLLCLVASPAHCADVTLAWDASSKAVGYKLYVGQASGIYNAPLDVGNVTAYTVQGLDGSKRYYFAVTAYGLCADRQNPDGPRIGCESGKSNEVSWTLAGGLVPATDVRVHLQVDKE